METTYHYRLVAGNSIDSNQGADDLHPARGDRPAHRGSDGSHPDSVQLNGSFDPNNADTHYYFEWGPTAPAATRQPPRLEWTPAAPPGTKS